MPSDAALQSQSKRPSLEGHRSNSSQRVLRHHDNSDSPSSTPPSNAHKVKTAKTHAVVHRHHSRVPSYGKSLHKLAKAHTSDNHGNVKGHRRSLIVSPGTSPGSSSMKRVGSEPNVSRNGSTSSLKKNSSHVSLKRNKSHGEVKRPKSSGTLKRNSTHGGATTGAHKSPHKTTVHFDLGNDDDAWTEASGSTSPNLSRGGSVAGGSSGRNSAKPGTSASNSQSHSPSASVVKHSAEGQDWSHKGDRNTTPDAHQITSRLLQRTPSSNAPPKMSSISVTATSATPESFQHVDAATLTATPSSARKDELVSRFKDNRNSSGETSSPFFRSGGNTTPDGPRADKEEARRIKSMGNLTRHDSSLDDDSDRALAPRSRQTSGNAYNPPQQSRTQQKLWLQRASSNIEPQQLGSHVGTGINGLITGLHPGAHSSLLVGYDGRDPRIRAQLERTGQEYLVVRRYQDPIGRALKRLDYLPGAEKNRRIPHGRRNLDGGASGAGQGRYGLSQSLREARTSRTSGDRERGHHGAGHNGPTSSGGRSSYDGPAAPAAAAASGSGSAGSDPTADGDDGLGAMLRTLWEKSLDISPGEE